MADLADSRAIRRVVRRLDGSDLRRTLVLGLIDGTREAQRVAALTTVLALAAGVVAWRGWQWPPIVLAVAIGPGMFAYGICLGGVDRRHQRTRAALRSMVESRLAEAAAGDPDAVRWFDDLGVALATICPPHATSLHRTVEQVFAVHRDQLHTVPAALLVLAVATGKDRLAATHDRASALGPPFAAIWPATWVLLAGQLVAVPCVSATELCDLLESLEPDARHVFATLINDTAASRPGVVDASTLATYAEIAACCAAA